MQWFSVGLQLQRMQAKVMDLWDHMGVTLDQQKEYRYIMRNSVASLAEVTQKDALSAALLTKVSTSSTWVQYCTN
jgi:hypothetical protein